MDCIEEAAAAAGRTTSQAIWLGMGLAGWLEVATGLNYPLTRSAFGTYWPYSAFDFEECELLCQLPAAV